MEIEPELSIEQEKSMKQKLKMLSRITQLAIIMMLILSVGIVAYAAINAWISKSWQSELTKGDVMEMELVQGSVSGEIVPGGMISVSTAIKNTGTKQTLAFVKVEMPVYGSGFPAYTFTADSSWTKLAYDGATQSFMDITGF